MHQNLKRDRIKDMSYHYRRAECATRGGIDLGVHRPNSHGFHRQSVYKKMSPFGSKTNFLIDIPDKTIQSERSVECKPQLLIQSRSKQNSDFGTSWIVRYAKS
jgi:hypothetical protein